MKVSAVGSTKSLIFEPENKKDLKWLSNYSLNNEYMKTKNAQLNPIVTFGALAGSFASAFVGLFAKGKAHTMSTVLFVATAVTSIAFAVKDLVDRNKFKEKLVEQQLQDMQTAPTAKQE